MLKRRSCHTEGRKITSTLTKCLDRADTLQNTEAFTSSVVLSVTAGVLKTLPLYAMRADSPERHVPSVLASGLR